MDYTREEMLGLLENRCREVLDPEIIIDYVYQYFGLDETLHFYRNLASDYNLD